METRLRLYLTILLLCFAMGGGYPSGEIIAQESQAPVVFVTPDQPFGIDVLCTGGSCKHLKWERQLSNQDWAYLADSQSSDGHHMIQDQLALNEAARYRATDFLTEWACDANGCDPTGYIEYGEPGPSSSWAVGFIKVVIPPGACAAPSITP